jgi:hypothetical protein
LTRPTYVVDTGQVLLSSAAAADRELERITQFHGRWHTGAAEAAPAVAEAKQRKDAALAQLAELELQQRRGELVPLEQVAAEWFARRRQLRDVMQAIPGRTHAQLAALLDVDPGRLRLVMEEEIGQALRELAEAVRATPAA